jgi:ribonuclease-3
VLPKDAKTFLQEWTLGKSLGIPGYQVVSREGPDHAPRFAIEVTVSGRQPARGEGASKRLAEQAAAEAFLQRENLRA